MQLKYIVIKNVVSQDQSEYVVEAEAKVINTTQAKLNEREFSANGPVSQSMASCQEYTLIGGKICKICEDLKIFLRETELHSSYKEIIRESPCNSEGCINKPGARLLMTIKPKARVN